MTGCFWLLASDSEKSGFICLYLLWWCLVDFRAKPYAGERPVPHALFENEIIKRHRRGVLKDYACEGPILIG